MPATQQLKTLSPAQYAFISWLYENHPNIAREAEERREGVSGFMDSLTNVFDTVMTKGPDLFNQYVAGKEKIELLKVNLARAKANAYPISEGGSIYTGGGVTQQLQTGIAGVPTWAWIAGAAVLTYLLFARK